MPKQEIHYFTKTLGSAGFVDYTAENVSHLERFSYLYGYPLAIISQWVRAAQKTAVERGYPCEIIHHFLEDTPIGIVLPTLSSGFLCVPFDALSMEHFDSLCLSNEKTAFLSALSKAQDCFGRAKKIHDDWEKIYISQMDFAACDLLSETVIQKIMGEHQGCDTGRVFVRFLGAATAEGAVDKIESITAGLLRRYFIKGRPGTGKSTMLRKLVAAATAAGFNVEEYHCSFDPKSLDMVVIRALGVCLFDSTAPHEHFPSRPGDEVVDVYEAAVMEGTDERFEKELSRIADEYKFKMLEAKKELSHARDVFQRIEKLRLSQMDAAACEHAQNEVLGRIF